MATACWLFAQSALLAQWSNTTLPGGGRYNIGTAVIGTKAIFAGGRTSYYANSNKADIYETTSGTWTTKTFNQARHSITTAVLNDRAIFAGGQSVTVNGPFFSNKVDIYNNTSNTWATKTLSQARIVGGAGAAGGKAVFFGGVRGTNPNTYNPIVSNRADVYEYATNTFSWVNRPVARAGMATAVVGSKIIFAGGIKSYTAAGDPVATNAIDIYDAATGTWSTTTLSTARYGVAAAVVGNKALFAGGYVFDSNAGYVLSDKVDVFDGATGTWSTLTLAQPQGDMCAAVAGNLAFFAGGLEAGAQASARVNIYDSAAGTWDVDTLSAPRLWLVATVTNHRVMFAGGSSPNTLLDVYDRDNDVWTTDNLPQARIAEAVASVNNRAIFAGGRVNNAYPIYGSALVNIFQDAPLLPAAVAERASAPNERPTLRLAPNPAAAGGFTEIQLSNFDFSKKQPEALLFDAAGRLVRREKIVGERQRLGLEGLLPGTYFLKTSAAELPVCQLIILK